MGYDVLKPYSFSAGTYCANDARLLLPLSQNNGSTKRISPLHHWQNSKNVLIFLVLSWNSATLTGYSGQKRGIGSSVMAPHPKKGLASQRPPFFRQSRLRKRRSHDNPDPEVRWLWQGIWRRSWRSDVWELLRSLGERSREAGNTVSLLRPGSWLLRMPSRVISDNCSSTNGEPWTMRPPFFSFTNTLFASQNLFHGSSFS